ncbi:hypothetical protein CBI38_36260 (plasmid) [Rhodococcus oxybenzonivorans]|uniref:Uncharacterized protein n=1 Tax=Rhodococcus oxybenzonivorans TaxID=1990687 RepID=A0A2S2C7K4_9NOCA|nr:hypothetical protein CBI38_36260 [Rhodococcus oxybenzonivorans]
MWRLGFRGHTVSDMVAYPRPTEIVMPTGDNESFRKAIDLTKEKIHALTRFFRNLFRGKSAGGPTA